MRIRPLTGLIFLLLGGFVSTLCAQGGLLIISWNVTLPSIDAQGILKPSEWSALHNRDISGWEKKTSMSREWIEKILEGIARGGVDNPYLIKNLDPVHLKNRGQVFLALMDSGTARALAVYVVDGESTVQESAGGRWSS